MYKDKDTTMKQMLIALQNMLRSFVSLSATNMDKIAYAKQERIVDNIIEQCTQISKLNDAKPSLKGCDSASDKVNYAMSIMDKSARWRLKPALTVLGMQFTDAKDESVIDADELVAKILKGINK